MTEIIENGQVLEQSDWSSKAALLQQEQPRLQAGSLKRLARLQAVLQGATDVAQAAVNAQQTARTNYQQAFEEAAENEGIAIPPGPHDVNIDFATGQVAFVPKVS